MSANPFVAPGSDALVPVIQGPHSPWPRTRTAASRTGIAPGAVTRPAGPTRF